MAVTTSLGIRVSRQRSITLGHGGSQSIWIDRQEEKIVEWQIPVHRTCPGSFQWCTLCRYCKAYCSASESQPWRLGKSLAVSEDIKSYIDRICSSVACCQYYQQGNTSRLSTRVHLSYADPPSEICYWTTASHKSLSSTWSWR